MIWNIWVTEKVDLEFRPQIGTAKTSSKYILINSIEMIKQQINPFYEENHEVEVHTKPIKYLMLIPWFSFFS